MMGFNVANGIIRFKSEILLIDTYICSQILTYMKGFFGLFLIMVCHLMAGAQKTGIQQMKTDLEKSNQCTLVCERCFKEKIQDRYRNRSEDRVVFEPGRQYCLCWKNQ